jgi:hypothetical protein
MVVIVCRQRVPTQRARLGACSSSSSSELSCTWPAQRLVVFACLSLDVCVCVCVCVFMYSPTYPVMSWSPSPPDEGYPRQPPPTTPPRCSSVAACCAGSALGSLERGRRVHCAAGSVGAGAARIKGCRPVHRAGNESTCFGSGRPLDPALVRVHVQTAAANFGNVTS